MTRLTEEIISNLSLSKFEVQLLTTSLKALTKDQKAQAIAVDDRVIAEAYRIKEVLKSQEVVVPFYEQSDNVQQGIKRFY